VHRLQRAARRALQPVHLAATLGRKLSAGTLAEIDLTPVAGQSAMMLGGPDFMRR